MSHIRAGGFVVVALTLIAPVAQAECAKATAMRPCHQGREVTRRLPQRAKVAATRPEARSVGLVVGGIGTIMVGLAGFGFGAVLSAARGCEYCSEPSSDSAAYLFSGTMIGLAGVLGGGTMIYFGALDAPVNAKQATFEPSMPLAPVVSLRFRL